MADGFAHHPYAFNASRQAREGSAGRRDAGHARPAHQPAPQAGQAAQAAHPAGGTLPLYLTEYGYFARGPRSLREARRSAYLLKGFQMALLTAR